ncbi:MAG: ferritin [Bacteroidales bacterium]|jgi:ferritin|nr:ferritin [Bacteroidales bacterium]
MINSKVEAAINEQINAEFWSAYLYLSMANYFNSIGLSGFANWMEVQFEEEVFHARKFMTYLNERGGRVLLKPIEEVQTEWEGTLNVFEDTLAHEEKVTSLVNNLMDIAIKESDHATKSFLQWFIDEQVEEEANVSEILDSLRLINGEGHGLFMMDKEMKARTFVPPAQ